MKKNLVLALVLVFVLSISGAAFAAANPFVDVPAKHWAYDAVSKLAKAGIVDGYGDGTFRGDKTMTRYEMAQIVAKAMAKSDKADAEQKAMIDKLSVEFAAELNNLGVRVTKLEQNQANLKFSGILSQRFRGVEYDNKIVDHSDVAQYRLRLDAKATVDDKTSFGMRIVTNAPDKDAFKNDSWAKYGSADNDADNDNNINIDRVFFTTKLGVVDTTLGRQAFVVDPYSIIVDSGYFSFDGVKFATKAGALTISTNYGRFTDGVTIEKVAAAASDIYGNLDTYGINVSGKAGKLDYGIGYQKFKNTTQDADALQYTLGNLTYNFTNKFSLGGEYIKNSKELYGTVNDDNKDAWSVKAVLGDQKLVKKGNQNFVAQYSDVGRNALVNNFTTLDTPGNNIWNDYKVLDLNYNYAFSKNFNGQFQFVTVDDKQAANDTNDFKYYKLTLNVMF